MERMPGYSGRAAGLVEPEIIWAAVSGDTEAMDVIYEHYVGYGITLANAIMRKQYRKGYFVQMEDILQEAWELIFTKDIRKFRGN